MLRYEVESKRTENMLVSSTVIHYELDGLEATRETIGVRQFDPHYWEVCYLRTVEGRAIPTTGGLMHHIARRK